MYLGICAIFSIDTILLKINIFRDSKNNSKIMYFTRLDCFAGPVCLRHLERLFISPHFIVWTSNMKKRESTLQNSASTNREGTHSLFVTRRGSNPRPMRIFLTPPPLTGRVVTKKFSFLPPPMGGGHFDDVLQNEKLHLKWRYRGNIEVIYWLCRCYTFKSLNYFFIFSPLEKSPLQALIPILISC